MVVKLRNATPPSPRGPRRAPRAPDPGGDHGRRDGADGAGVRRAAPPGDGVPRATHGSARSAHWPTFADHHAIIMERAPGPDAGAAGRGGAGCTRRRRRGGPAPEPVFRAVGTWLRALPRRHADSQPSGPAGHVRGRGGPLRGARGVPGTPTGATLRWPGRRRFSARGRAAASGGPAARGGARRLRPPQPPGRPRGPTRRPGPPGPVGGPCPGGPVPVPGRSAAQRTAGAHPGAAYGEDTLARWQRQVVDGYYGDAVPWGALRCYQLLVLLDKWSALVKPARTAARVPRLRRLSRSRPRPATCGGRPSGCSAWPAQRTAEPPAGPRSPTAARPAPRAPSSRAATSPANPWRSLATVSGGGVGRSSA